MTKLILCCELNKNELLILFIIVIISQSFVLIVRLALYFFELPNCQVLLYSVFILRLNFSLVECFVSISTCDI